MREVILSYWDWFAHVIIKPYHNEITAISTCGIAVYTIILACVARRQTKDTRILQRAYLTVRSVGIQMHRNRNKCVAHIDIVNSGNLPATRTQWFIRAELNDQKDWKIGIDSRRSHFEGDNVIAPHSKMRQGSHEIAVGAPNGLRHQEDLFLYVFGAVTYRDGFRWRRRVTTFCHRYNCVNFTHNPQWGFTAMPGATARDNRSGNSAT